MGKMISSIGLHWNQNHLTMLNLRNLYYGKLFVGGETIFREKWMGGKNKDPLPWGAIDRSSLTALNVGQVCCEKPHILKNVFYDNIEIH